MNMREKSLMTVMIIAFLGVFLCSEGCKKSAKENSDEKEAGTKAVLLCIKCGQINGDELCCKANQIKCPKCGLAKGSPGCCKIPEGAQIAALCTMCNKVIIDKACCGCYDGKCPVEEFAQTHRYPYPKETK